MDLKYSVSTRLLSLDVFRGITIVAMILVNNPGEWDNRFAALKHAQWNGLTPTDLIYPFFMFIMGISMCFSYTKFNFKFSKQLLIKIVRRATFLFLIGVLLGWLGLFLKGFNELKNENIDFVSRLIYAITDFENIRILGVLQRLAIVSLIGSIIVLLVKPNRLPWIIGIILLSYWLIMAFSVSYAQDDNNLATIIDREILGATHLHFDRLQDGTLYIFEPEGLLSTIPCIAHVLLGFLFGKILLESKEINQAVQKILILGTILLFIGFLLDYSFPINKKLWSSSYVLVSCGLGALFLGLLIWIIDIREHKKWINFFESFGINPLFMYTFAGVLSTLLVKIYFKSDGHWISLKSFIVNNFINLFADGNWGSLIYAVLYVILNWVIADILYRRKILIKL